MVGHMVTIGSLSIDTEEEIMEALEKYEAGKIYRKLLEYLKYIEEQVEARGV
jgi:hypothetical protein